MPVKKDKSRVKLKDYSYNNVKRGFQMLHEFDWLGKIVEKLSAIFRVRHHHEKGIFHTIILSA